MIRATLSNYKMYVTQPCRVRRNARCICPSKRLGAETPNAGCRSFFLFFFSFYSPDQDVIRRERIRKVKVPSRYIASSFPLAKGHKVWISEIETCPREGEAGEGKVIKNKNKIKTL